MEDSTRHIGKERNGRTEPCGDWSFRRWHFGRNRTDANILQQLLTEARLDSSVDETLEQENGFLGQVKENLDRDGKS
jgi:hypothetical protein